MPEVVVGKDVITGELITIGDLERRAGLYILGRSGMGKTHLIVNIMRQDIDHDHGLFFLDPHDGINRLKNCCTSRRLLTDLVDINIQDDTYSVGINLLSCKDVTNWAHRKDAYNRARGVFFKLFEKEFGDRPWLESIIRHYQGWLMCNQYALPSCRRTSGRSDGV
jgi:hypothetical protein